MSPGAKAEATVIRQVLDACEAARTFHGYSVKDVASRAGLSLRMLQYVRAGRGGSLRRLLAITDACGLELVIKVRVKQSRVEDAKE